MQFLLIHNLNLFHNLLVQLKYLVLNPWLDGNMGINISYQTDKKNKYIINGIENRIEQIIANLLENAISFSEDNKNIIVKV